MEPAPFEYTSINALLPPEMARRAEELGAKKCQMDARIVFVLAVLAGAFIALGAIFATVVMADSSAHLGFGLTRLLGGLAFCLGLILVIVAGGELFTGNNLIVMAWASRRVSLGSLLRNWLIVYTGNFVGALATAALVLLSRSYTAGAGAVGVQALATAAYKCQHDFVQAFALGVLCNGLVCLAVWLTYSARSTTDKILSILFPIAAFVAAGFEHSVANMYFIPFGLLLKQFDPAWVAANAAQLDLAPLTVQNFLLNNLLPVTLGNIIGGSVLVGLFYWFVYLRPRS
jgi:formate transporter FocA